MTEFSDVYIVPQYSDVTSRSKVDTSSILDPKHSRTSIRVPVISANMDTVTDGHMALKMAQAGAIGAIHRFLSIENNIEEWVKVKGMSCLVSVGVGEQSKNRAEALYAAGARKFIIDIAHGHHHLMKDMISFFRKNFPDAYIMAGNVATDIGAIELAQWGAHAIKVGIGPGAACTTKNVTGVTVPQFTAIKQAVKAKEVDPDIVIVADGGVREIGDIAKALGVGADFVMCGRLFAGCRETPHPGIYRGMASLDAMKSVRLTDKLPTPEGKTMTVQTDSHVEEVVQLIEGGLQSAFSYSNSLTLDEFHERCRFGMRRNELER